MKTVTMAVGVIMTASEAIKLIGQTGTMRTSEGLTFEVLVTDVRQVYGREQAQVTPVSGCGMAWIMLERVILAGEAL
jgi:hypothetical protein